MKVEIQAGAKIDVATPKEVRDEIRAAQSSFITEISRGDRFRRISAYGDVQADGTLIIGGIGEGLGPASGMVWSVCRLGLVNRGPGLVLGLYISSVESSSCVMHTMPDYADLSGNQLVLYPGDRLIVAGSGGTPPNRVWLTGQVRELPLSTAWRL